MENSSRCSKTAPFVFLLLAFLLHSLAPAQQWTSAGTLTVQRYGYAFLAATPQGDLLATTFNSSPPESKKIIDLPAVLIRSPQNNPAIVELCRFPFEPQRGYSGIACGPDGHFFVSGDTGNATTSFIRKFLPSGAPDTAFGRGGIVMPNRRCLGMDIIANYLLVAVEWGTIQVYDTQTGRMLGELPKAQGSHFLRDIAIDPKSLRIFGVASGGVLTWGSGAPWNPVSYQFRAISPAVTDPRAGEGICMDPLRRTVLITPIPGNTLREIHGTGQVDAYQVLSAAPDAHLADSSISFDGTTLFISDMRAQQIHIMRRTIDAARAQSAAPKQQYTSGEVPSPVWHHSYEEIVEAARTQKKPMLVYFRMGDHPASTEVERNIVLTDEFNRRAGKFVCVFEDLKKNRLLAHRFGVYRIPFLTIIDSSGEVSAEFRYEIPAEQLFAAMDAAK